MSKVPSSAPAQPSAGVLQKKMAFLVLGTHFLKTGVLFTAPLVSHSGPPSLSLCLLHCLCSSSEDTAAVYSGTIKTAVPRGSRVQGESSGEVSCARADCCKEN